MYYCLYKSLIQSASSHNKVILTGGYDMLKMGLIALELQSSSIKHYINSFTDKHSKYNTIIVECYILQV